MDGEIKKDLLNQDAVKTSEIQPDAPIQKNDSAMLAAEQRMPVSGDFKVIEGKKAAETEETKKMKANYAFFGPATVLYAVFYAFCMYKNASGITFPFFAAGSLLYFCFSMKKLGVTLKRDSVFYAVSMMLLAVSTFCTDDSRIIFFNKTGVFLLMISFLLGQFFRTDGWKLGKYLIAIPEIIFGSLAQIIRPVEDLERYFAAKKKEENKKSIRNSYYIFLGLIISIPLLLITGLLLCSADAVFREQMSFVKMDVQLTDIVRVFLKILFWYFAVYALVANLCEKRMKCEVKDHRTGEPVIAITVTGLLTAMYLFFCWIQIACLFLGSMELPKGYTYAQYAREGFFQLLAVSILNLVIVLFCLCFFRESRILKGILTLMSLCTFVMIASSAMRMIIYIRYYYLTFQRILVLWALAVLTLLFVGILIQIFKKEFELFRYGVMVVTVFYILLSFSHPDLIIAKVNIANAPGSMEEMVSYRKGEKTGVNPAENAFFLSSMPYEDYKYLAELSADAAPALIPYLKSLGYDMNAFTQLKKYDKQDGYPEYFDWREKFSEMGIKEHGAKKPESFGYYYLGNLYDSVRKMNFRTFNLSRFFAGQVINK